VIRPQSNELAFVVGLQGNRPVDEKLDIIGEVNTGGYAIRRRPYQQGWIYQIEIGSSELGERLVCGFFSASEVGHPEL
jgi:hypothetical protein